MALASGDIRATIRAAIAVLDRTGHGPTREVILDQVSREEDSAWMKYATKEELRTVVDIANAATKRMNDAEPGSPSLEL